MPNPDTQIVNVETGEVEIRPMTDDEFAEYTKSKSDTAAREAAELAEAEAAAAVLFAKTGLTVEQYKALNL